MRLFHVELTRPRLAVLAGLLIGSVVVAAGTFLMLPPKYSATTQAVVIGPPTVLGQAANPYLQFSEALGVTADVLLLGANTQQAQQSVVSQGGTSTYTATRPANSNEPILTIAGIARNKPQAVRTAQLVLAYIGAELNARQRSEQIAPRNQLKLVTISPAERAKRVLKGPIEAGLGVFALCLICSLVAFVSINKRLARRRAALAAQRRTRPQVVPDTVPLAVHRGRDGVELRVATPGDEAGLDGSAGGQHPEEEELDMLRATLRAREHPAARHHRS